MNKAKLEQRNHIGIILKMHNLKSQIKRDAKIKKNLFNLIFEAS